MTPGIGWMAVQQRVLGHAYQLGNFALVAPVAIGLVVAISAYRLLGRPQEA